MTNAEFHVAFAAAANLLLKSEPTEANANRTLDLLEVLMDDPASFWDAFNIVQQADHAS